MIIFLFLWFVGTSAQIHFEAAYRNRETRTLPVTHAVDYPRTISPFDPINSNDEGEARMRAIQDYVGSQSSTKTSSSWINVKDLGAKGDGLTDDTANINAAIAAGAGGVVYFPKGTYLIKQLSTPAANTRILGDGKGITFLKRNKSTNDAYILLLGNSGSSLSDLTIDGNRANNRGISGGELVVTGEDVDLNNFEITNSEWLSLQIQGRRTRIRNCNLTGSASGVEGALMGIWMATSAATDTVIEGCTISDYRLGAIFAGGAGAEAAGRIRIINNIFSGNHRQNKDSGGGQVAFGGIGGHVVIGNTFIVGGGSDSTITSGIEANGGATIVGNSFHGGGIHMDGIVLQVGSRYSVSANQVTGFRGSGLLVNAGVTDLTITGNDLTGNAVPIADGSTTLEKQVSANLPVSTNDKTQRNKWWRIRQGGRG